MACASSPPPDSGNGPSNPVNDPGGETGDDDPGGTGGGTGGDDDPNGDDDDPGVTPGVDAGPCVAVTGVTSLADPEAIIGPQEDAPTQQVRMLWGTVGSGTTLVDLLEVSLWDGLGEFAGGVAQPGTYMLGAGDEECGVCVALYVGLDPNSDAEPNQVHVAVSGTVTIDSVDGNLRGSLSNVTLHRVDATTGDFDATCESSVTSATFDAPLGLDDGT